MPKIGNNCYSLIWSNWTAACTIPSPNQEMWLSEHCWSWVGNICLDADSCYRHYPHEDGSCTNARGRGSMLMPILLHTFKAWRKLLNHAISFSSSALSTLAVALHGFRWRLFMSTATWFFLNWRFMGSNLALSACKANVLPLSPMPLVKLHLLKSPSAGWTDLVLRLPVRLALFAMCLFYISNQQAQKQFF